MEELIKIARANYRSVDTIDIDVLSKMKQENASLITMLKVLGSLGFSLKDAQIIASRSVYYGDSYANAASFTESLFELLNRIDNKS
ncbi:hypothetical protein [Taibaiella chishuiensis]|uniref:Uncharacterized protein n=1 Tax=Taibaiella chishuiensis TaxID=1434707 RepID=A0A2P8D7E2_9BACT|nr:hypothetical protein [Taibaiella chishuiensis]PSK93128.1 hypothetical protein B0I18_10297 [Taibaiella chishuiensis]